MTISFYFPLSCSYFTGQAEGFLLCLGGSNMRLQFGDLLKAHYENGYWVTTDGTYWLILDNESPESETEIGVIGYDCKEQHHNTQLEIMKNVVDTLRRHKKEFEQLDIHDKKRRLQNILNVEKINRGLHLEFYVVNKNSFDFFQPFIASNRDAVRFLKKLGDNFEVR